MSRDVKLELRSKNARLLDAIEERWGKVIDQVWDSREGKGRSARPFFAVSSQLSGVRTSVISGLINLKLPAYDKRNGKPTRAALKLANALDVPTGDLFPPKLCDKGIKAIEWHVSIPQFVSISEASSLSVSAPDDSDEVVRANTKHLLDKILDTKLDPVQRDVIRSRFGLDGEPEWQHTIGERHGVSKTRIAQIEIKAMRILRGPANTKLLRPMLEAASKKS